MNQSIRLDVNPMMAEYVGPRGIARADLDALVPELKRAHAAVEAGRGKDMQGWMDLPYNQEEVVADIEATAAKVREEFDAFVVLGIGGSALGPAAVQAALNHLHYNELPAEKRGAPKLYVEYNIDPERMAALMDVIDLSKTCFNVITKSRSPSARASRRSTSPMASAAASPNCARSACSRRRSATSTSARCLRAQRTWTSAARPTRSLPTRRCWTRG